MNTKSNRSGGNNRTSQNLRHNAGPGMSLADFALMAIFVTSLVLVPMALFAMGEESGPAASFKYLLVGFAAAGAAYGVNRFAVDRLAPLHALGFNLAGAVAITGILLTGSGTALGSFTGIIVKSVEVKILQEAGQELTDFIGSANEAALIAARIGPAVEAVADDIALTAACEVQTSCLSRNGTGGRGSMSRALDTAAAQAFAIADALQMGELERDQLLENLNRLNTEYHEILSDSRRAVTVRRSALQSIHSEIRQVAAALKEAVPVALVEGYVSNLRAGVSLPGNPTGSRVLSAYLRGHGGGLAEQLGGLPEAELVAPIFPDRPGMIEVLKYLPTYIAIAAIVIVGELILPLSLYLMTFMQRVRELEILDTVPADIPGQDPFKGLIDRPDTTDRNSDGRSS